MGKREPAATKIGYSPETERPLFADLYFRCGAYSVEKLENVLIGISCQPQSQSRIAPTNPRKFGQNDLGSVQHEVAFPPRPKLNEGSEGLQSLECLRKSRFSTE